MISFTADPSKRDIHHAPARIDGFAKLRLAEPATFPLFSEVLFKDGVVAGLRLADARNSSGERSIAVGPLLRFLSRAPAHQDRNRDVTAGHRQREERDARSAAHDVASA